ncbi:MAG: universal stress protein [Deltaproteobacteria bacterium]|nr:MAG: universal stress protein [Deltaproteobacteria bacterium]
MHDNVLLVPVDLAGPTEPVVQMACKLAACFDYAVTLLHVVHLPIGVPPAGALPLGLLDTDTARGMLGEEAGQHLETLHAAFHARGVPVSHLVRQGDPAITIGEVADEIGASHIVMGTHGRKGLERALLGSVAERVLRRSGCPLTIVRVRDTTG